MKTEFKSVKKCNIHNIMCVWNMFISDYFHIFSALYVFMKKHRAERISIYKRIFK